MMVDGFRFFYYLYTALNTIVIYNHEQDNKNPLQK